MRRPAALAAIARLVPLAALLAPGTVQAQWSGSIGIDSQAVFRGYALSNGHPSPHAALAYDAASGTYAGVSAARVELTAGQASAQWSGYAGHASRFVSDRALGWEAGVVTTQYTLNPDNDYTEGYVGLLGDGWNLRLHAAPDYFGSGATAFHVQAGASIPLRSGWRWLGQIGVTRAPASMPAGGHRLWRADWRLGLAADWQQLTLQLAWVGAQPTRRAAGTGTDNNDASYHYLPAALRPVTGTWQLSANVYF